MLNFYKAKIEELKQLLEYLENNPSIRSASLFFDDRVQGGKRKDSFITREEQKEKIKEKIKYYNNLMIDELLK